MSTTSSKNCPQCGSPLPANTRAGLCPRCVMEMNLATPTEFTSETGPQGTKVLKQVPSPQELASKFPQLEIIELLGRGGMGAVYKARQKELDRIVALKILPPGTGDESAFAERFWREARALAKLNHPNIVTLYEFGRADGLFFFLMEYVDGVNLRQLLGSERVSPREALAIVPQICDALQYAHDHGIVHRDIKPENILMDRRGRIKVADFGIARLVAVGNETSGAGESAPAGQGALTEAGKVVGTPQYMAPEQFEKPSEVDHRADIYALGVVFYQMLTGELPGQRIEPPSKKVQIDVRLDEIVLRALEKNPDRRYEQASVLKTQVEDFANEERVPPSVTQLDPDQGNVRDQLTKAKVNWPALALLVSAAVFLLETLHFGFSGKWKQGIFAPYNREVIILARVAAAGIVAFGGLQMLRLRNFEWAVAASLTLLLCAVGLREYWHIPIGVWALSVLLRADVRQAFENGKRRPELGTEGARDAGKGYGGATTDPHSSSQPRFSREAIIGAVWVPFVIAAVAFLVFEPRHIPFPYGYTFLAQFLIYVCLAGILGTTILGWIAVSETRRAPRRVQGFGLALFDSLVFPMVVLDALIAVVAMRAKLGFPEAVLLFLMIDVFLIWEAWRTFYPGGVSQDTSGPVTRRSGWLLIAGPIALVTLIFAGCFLKVMVDAENQKSRQQIIGASKNSELNEISGVVKAPDSGTRARAKSDTPISGMDVEELLYAIDDSVARIERAAAADLLVDMANRLDELNEYCDQLQGKNGNVAPGAHQWKIDDQTYQEIRKLLAGMENDAEGMRSVAKFKKYSEAERVALMKKVWQEQFLPRYKELKRRVGANDAARPLPSQKETGSAAAAPTNRISPDRVRFGPVIERTLPDPDNGAGKGNADTLRLRTGEQMSLLDNAPKEQGGRLRALVASKGDLFAEYDDYVSKNWAFVTAGIRFSDFPAAQWETATVEDLGKALREPTVLQRVEQAGATLYLLPQNFAPLTLAFVTREGDRGLLQVTRFEENPRTLKLRYKLTTYDRSDAAAALEPVPPRALKLSEEIQALYQRMNNADPSRAPVMEKVFQSQLATLTKELNFALQGTVAEPLLREQQAETLKYQQAQQTKDTEKAKAAKKRIAELGATLIKLIDPNVTTINGEATARSTGGIAGERLSGEKEILLSGTNAAKPAFIDFDTGRVFIAPPELQKQRLSANEFTNLWHWAVTNGVDAQSDTSPEVRGLRWFGMSIARVPDSEWEKATAQSITFAVHKREADAAFAQIKIPLPNSETFQAVASANSLTVDKSQSRTFAFRTSENRAGVLQFVNVSDEPNGFVRLRYKLLCLPLTAEDYNALIKEIAAAYSQFVRGDPTTRGNNISAKFWGPVLRKMKPLRLVDDRVNVKIVFAEDETVETGWYVNQVYSSHAPNVKDFLEFTLLDSSDRERFGSIYHYTLAKKRP